jgi:histone acetyltransferase MYST1
VGRYVICTWYFSPFVKELTKYPRIHICPMCLSQFVLEDTYGYHYNTCKTTQPPGHRLYATEDLAIFEVDPKDGDEQTLYCQLLSLLGKCFIKEKTLVFYVGDFRFYVLCEKRQGSDGRDRYEVVGYFSKEKMSEENYNLACLVVLPPYMSKGWLKLRSYCRNFGQFDYRHSYEYD